MTADTSAEPIALAFPFDNSYARLPDRFYARVSPEPVERPRMLRVNRPLAEELGLDPDALDTAEGAEALSGNRPPQGADPLAMAYAGHQFGGWVPQLGDGRAHLLGEIVDRNGKRRDIQLKGSGRTPFSRMGDGRAPVGPVLREYMVSEGMAMLGVPTTRALAAVATGERVVRQTVSPGAVLARVAASHIRVGTFQFFAARGDEDGLRTLAGHAIERHDPEAADAEDPYRALLDGVVARQARLVAQWMGLGFIHGVMNTDNMTISGETIDYGPCAFMEDYHPARVFSSIDHGGRYAYANQPAVAQWNLACLAQALLPIMKGDRETALASAQEAIDAFVGIYQEAWLGTMRAKLGLAQAEEDDRQLAEDLLSAMARNGADFTLTFRRLAELPQGDGPRGLFEKPGDFDEWAEVWAARLARENRDAEQRRKAMLRTNPLYIPRNHLVEEAIRAAERDDLGPFERLLAVIANPFEEQAGAERHARPAGPQERVCETFCGT